MSTILIIGGSGFIGSALYKELTPFYNTHATYYSDNKLYNSNQHYHQYDMETEEISILLDNLKPTFIISALRGNANGLVYLHERLASWVRINDSRLLFLSSANVFDRFTNYPSYEYDKTFSESPYGRLKIKIENDLLRLPATKFVICRIPMIYGKRSPRVLELSHKLEHKEAIEVFPNVVINATHIDKLVQQVHYIINRRRRGIFHLGSKDLTHHIDLIRDIAHYMGTPHPILKQVYDSNEDRQLSVLPKENILPKHLQVTIQEVILSCG